MHVCVCACARSAVSDSATPCTVARQTPLSMGFPGKNPLPFPPPRDPPDPEIKPTSPVSRVGRWILHHRATWEAQLYSKTDVCDQLRRQAKNLLLRLREAYPLQSYVIYAQTHSFRMDISMIFFFLLICN